MPDAERKITVVGRILWSLMVGVAIAGLPGLADAQDEPNTAEIAIVAGRSTLVRAPWPTSRVAVTDPAVADVQVLTPEQVLVQGLKVGATDLILWSENEQQTWQRRVVVRLDVSTLPRMLESLFPSASLQVSASEEVVVVQGQLRSAEQAEQLHRFLEQRGVGYVDMTSVAGVQQVQLQVRVAEVSRNALRTLGINAFHTSDRFFFGQRVGSSGGGALVPSINIGPGEAQDIANSLVFLTPDDGIGVSPPITLFGGFPKENLEIFLDALAENQYMRILANPTLVALSGEEASFLAGGEFPIPVVQGTGGGIGTTTAITIEYKEFGVRLAFRPVVLGDGGIRLEAAQEVSQLTDVGALVIQGFSIPALVTRRAETTLELKSGQSFAMAGLLQRNDTGTNSRIPGLGDLPILGSLFRSVRYRNEETELVILVTASLVEPMSVAKTPPLPGVTYTPPNDWELYVEGRLEGREPARIDPAAARWLQEMGFDQLVGPGAWEPYEGQMQ